MATETVLMLCVVSFGAGFIDAVAGGGGLLQIPALFLLLPTGTTPATVLGTNKFIALFGTLAATGRYLKAVAMDRRVVIPAAVAAIPFGLLGAAVVRHVDPAVFRPLVVILLVVVAIYTFFRKDFGSVRNAPQLSPATRLWVAAAVGAVLGFYDGFFGPGTGSFLIFACIGLFGLDFLSASATAKTMNCATNLAGLTYFIASGNVLYALALPMAVCNIAGGLTGARLAILKGSSFVRLLFLGVVLAVICKFGWDTFQPR